MQFFFLVGIRGFGATECAAKSSLLYLEQFFLPPETESCLGSSDIWLLYVDAPGMLVHVHMW